MYTYYSKQNTKILIQLSLLILAIILIKAEKVLRFGIKKLDVWTDPTFSTLKYDLDESIPKIDLIMTTLKDVPDLDIHVQATAVSRLNQNHFISINTTHSICKILDVKNNSPMATLIYIQIKKLGHLPDGCPIKKDTYTINGVWPDDHPAKLKLPELDSEGSITTYVVDGSTRTKIGEVKFAAEAVYKEVAELKRHGIIGVLHNVANPGRR